MDLLRPHLDVSAIHVYKNPPPSGLVPVEPREKTHDVVFLGRFRRVKGVDFLNPVLSALPPSYSVVLAGRGFDQFQLSPAVRCRVRVHGEVLGPDRYRLLAGARAGLMLTDSRIARWSCSSASRRVPWSWDGRSAATRRSPALI